MKSLKYSLILILIGISLNYCNDTSPGTAVLDTGDWVFTLYLDAEDPKVILPFNVKVVDPRLFEELLYQRTSYAEVCRKLSLCDLNPEDETNGNL